MQKLQGLVGELLELCPSADRKKWEACLLVSIRVYRVQVLVGGWAAVGDLGQNSHLEQSS